MLRHAIMAAYFGGRFENAVTGLVQKPVWNRDVFSAYPYAQVSLPCLACGAWRKARPGKVLDDVRVASLAVVRFRVKKLSEKERTKIAWLPLPFRDSNGSISYPSGFEGWAWKPEIEAALRGWPELIEVLDAWVYETKCEHAPFGWVPSAYRKRCEWGKDGPGIVLKLGTNACAGKTMQTAGGRPGPYNSWVWGGMTTATTRAQLLDAICRAKDPWNVLAVATDGLFTTEKLNLAKPRNTGTGDLEKPLGGWGSEEHPKGVFFCKPGMYFDDARALMRARGIGRKELAAHSDVLVKAFARWDRRSVLKVRVKSRRFFGARASVLGFAQCLKCGTGWPGAPSKGCPKCKEPGDKFDTAEMRFPDGKTSVYGRWASRDIDVEFASLPKREAIDHRSPHFGRMRVRDLGGAVSLPYVPGITSPEGEAARAANEQALDEPDWNDTDEGVEDFEG